MHSDVLNVYCAQCCQSSTSANGFMLWQINDKSARHVRALAETTTTVVSTLVGTSHTRARTPQVLCLDANIVCVYRTDQFLQARERHEWLSQKIPNMSASFPQTLIQQRQSHARDKNANRQQLYSGCRKLCASSRAPKQRDDVCQRDRKSNETWLLGNRRHCGDTHFCRGPQTRQHNGNQSAWHDWSAQLLLKAGQKSVRLFIVFEAVAHFAAPTVKIGFVFDVILLAVRLYL